MATSCVRPRTLGLMPPESPRYATAESFVSLPGSEAGVAVEGFFVRPKAKGRFPCAVLLHGRGGWWRAYVRYARELAGRGIASVIVNYYSGHYVNMESLDVPFPHRRRQFELQNKDIARATAAFSRNSICAGGKVGVIGFSLGADKAIRAAVDLSEIGVVVGYYGPYDYVKFIRHRVSRVLLALAGEDALRWKSYLEKNSPIEMAGKVRAKVLLFHGAADRTVPPGQSALMLGALLRRGSFKTRGRPGAAIKIYEGVGHNFVLRRSRGAERADSLRRTVAFLRKNLPSGAGPRGAGL